MLREAVYIYIFILCYSKIIVIADDECPANRQNSQMTLEVQLRKDILCDYNSNERPVKDHKKSVEVKVRFSLKYMSFDEPEDSLTIHSWVALTWKDEILPWTPSDYGGIQELVLESHNIWTPRMALFNADASQYNSDSFYTTCLVQYDGTIMCVPHLTHSAICTTKLRRWPYDTQSCTLFFGSWMHTGEQVNFTFYKKDPVVRDEFQPGPGWKLLDVKNKRLPGKYGCCPNNTYPMLRYIFELEREAAGHAAIIVVPSIVLVLLTLSSMLMDVKDNTRLILACFSLFGHFVFITEIGYDIPKHSSDTPIILLFLRDSMIMTVTVILITMLLMSLRKRTATAPSWIVTVNRLVSNGPAKYVVFTEFDPNDMKGLTETGTTLPVDRDGNHQTPSDWITFSNFFNSVFLIVMAFVYLVLICTYIPYGA